MGFEPGLFVRPPLRLARIEHAASSYRSVSLSRWFSRSQVSIEWEVTCLQCLHWCGGSVARSAWTFTATSVVVAICEDGRVRSAGQGAEHAGGTGDARGEPVVLGSGGVGGDRQLLGGREDPRAAREPGGGGQPGRHRDQQRPGEDRQARRARVGELVWKGELEAVWMPDERCRILRRRLARREQLTRARTRAKNEIHASLAAAAAGTPAVL